MITSIDLTQAAKALHAHFGPRYPASRVGGSHRFAAVLRDQFALDATEAERILASLVRSRAIAWEAAPGLPSPCPGLLELCGDWLIQPARAQGGERGGARAWPAGDPAQFADVTSQK
jgi:hypothetical protein